MIEFLCMGVGCEWLIGIIQPNLDSGQFGITIAPYCLPCDGLLTSTGWIHSYSTTFVINIVWVTKGMLHPQYLQPGHKLQYMHNYSY